MPAANFLNINTGPEDPLLLDSSKSYFQHQGYTRTAPFQIEYKDIKPQVGSNLGQTVSFVIPKAGDLLGRLDLMVEFEKLGFATDPTWQPGQAVGWVESIGYAMIDKLTFKVGNYTVEELTGDNLNILNELYRKPTDRLNHKHILRTGKPLVYGELTANADASAAASSGNGGTGTYNGSIVVSSTLSDAYNPNMDRIIAMNYGTSAAAPTLFDGKKLIVPLGFFFTTHVSKYFPLAAIAQSNEIRVEIKFRPFDELITLFNPVKATYTAEATNIDASNAISGTVGTFNALTTTGSTPHTISAPTYAFKSSSDFNFTGYSPANGTSWFKECDLRCEFVHVTGDESVQLMKTEQVRLMRLFSQNHNYKTLQVKCKKFDPAYTATDKGDKNTYSIDLNMLHPVESLIITIRKVSEMSSEKSCPGSLKPTDKNLKGVAKNYFAYHGDGKVPNIDHPSYCNKAVRGTRGQAPMHRTSGSTVKLENVKLTINGSVTQLDGSGLDAEYLTERIMPSMHSGFGHDFSDILAGSGAMTDSSEAELHISRLMDQQFQLAGRKNIFVYPLALAPEQHNPSGHVNFSKVSYARLDLELTGMLPKDVSSADAAAQATVEYIVDVYGVSFNWTSIKDGRALVTFA